MHTVSGQAFGGITATTPPINTVGANFIVIACGWGGAAAMTPTDSKGNSWTPLTEYSLTQTNIQFFYCFSPTTDPNHTFVLTNGIGSTFPILAVQAWSGVRAFDMESGGTGGPSTQPVPSGPITPSNNGSLLISAEVSINSAASTVDSGFTITDTTPNVGHGFGIAMSYLIQGAAATVNPTWTGTGTAIQVAAAAAFTPADVILSMGSGIATAGGTVTLPVTISSSVACTEVQWTFSCPGLTLQSVALGAAGAGKALNFGGNTVIVGGFDVLVIPDGVLVNCTFLVSFAASGTIPVTFTGIVASDASANALTTSSSGGSVIVPGASPITLPNGLTLNPTTGEISGYPTETGDFCIRYRVTDSLGATAETPDCCPLTITTPAGGCFSPISLLNPPPPTYGAQVCVGTTVVPKSLL